MKKFVSELLLALCAAGVFLNAQDSPQKKTSVNTSTEKRISISSLPDNIKLIVGQGEEHYLPRVTAIPALPSDLPPDQIQACYDFLYRKIETQKLRDLEFNGLKNELVWELIRQKVKPQELSGHLVRMYRDKSYDITWRDYCVQFFAKWYPAAPRNQARKEMVAGLWDALKNERQNRIAGTASSMLCFLALQYPEFDKTKVSQESLEALLDPTTSKISKVALLQACAELENKKALPEARLIASTEKHPVLRASAIAFLGRLGDQSDLLLLKRFEKSHDIRMQRPAKVAIEKILSRK